jgi:hypothetical protein
MPHCWLHSPRSHNPHDLLLSFRGAPLLEVTGDQEQPVASDIPSILHVERSRDGLQRNHQRTGVAA